MRSRLTWTCLVLALVVTAAGTIAQGRYSNRWGHALRNRQLAAALLDDVPPAFGSWQVVADLPVDEERLQKILQYDALLNREYFEPSTGRRVSAVIFVGPPGPTSTHSPELCFPSQGFAQASATEKFALEGSNGLRHEFARATFHSRDELSTDIAATYAWRQGDRWLVPDSARLAFGGGDYLFKVQVTTQATGPSERGDAARDFLRDFVKMLEQAVFAHLAAS